MGRIGGQTSNGTRSARNREMSSRSCGYGCAGTAAERVERGGIPKLTSDEAGWATQATVLDSGLIIAGVVLPNRAIDLTLRVLNPTTKPIQLRKGVRCQAEAIEGVEGGSDQRGALMCAQVGRVDPKETETVLEPRWMNVADELTEPDRDKLKEIILHHSKAFSINEWDLGYTDLLQHEIDTGDEPPVRQALRRQPLVQLPIIDEQVEIMLRQGLIERSCSEWASNVVIVTKKDGTPRFCV